MAVQTRNPTADVIASGTWSGSAGTRYTLIDDYPDATTTDILTHGTTAGNIYFNISNFTVPSGSTITNVELKYYDYKNGTSTAYMNGRLSFKNGTLVTTNDTQHNPGNGIANVALRTHTWTTNPKTGSGWTDAEVNGNGTAANSLAGFGFISTDANPTVSITSAQLSVTYTPPLIAGTTLLNINVQQYTSAAKNLNQKAALTQTSTIDVSGRREMTGALDADCVTMLNSNGPVERLGILDISSEATLTSNGPIDRLGILDISSAMTLDSNGPVDRLGALDINSVTTLSSNGPVDRGASASLSHAYSFSAIGTLITTAVEVTKYVYNIFKSTIFSSSIFK
jgi:hypothetical protein